MSNPSDPNIHVRAVRLFGWRAIAAVLAGLVVVVAVAALLALSFLLIVLPAMAIGAVAYYLLPKRPGHTLGDLNASNHAKNSTIIETNYSVTNDDDDGKPKIDHR
jgi:hypothetical protein